MTLRCRKGDLAIVLRSGSDRAGRICLVEEFIGMGHLLRRGLYTDIWRVSYNSETHSPITGLVWSARDCELLPIRPGDLDESEENEKTPEVAE